MSIVGKKFDIDGVVKDIIKEDETFAYFDGGVAIKKYLLGTKYEEYLDPSTFFNSGAQALKDMADKIKNYDGPVNESVGTQTQVNMSGVYQKPHAEDKVVPVVAKYDPNQTQQNYQSTNYNFDKSVNQNPNPQVQQHNEQQYTHQPPQQYIHQQPVQEKPEEALFKKLKRNVKSKFELTIEEMIPTADFIRMMNDNFETSIIDFLSRETVEKLLRDPEKIRKQIKAQLETIVYGAPIEEEVEEEIEQKPTVTIVEETIEEPLEEKPQVTVIETSVEEEVEEEIERPTVTIVQETIEEKPSIEEVKTEEIVTPEIVTNEKDLSADTSENA